VNIVINASPLILLSKIGRLTLLSGLFETVCIPSAVLQEIRAIDKAEINLSDNVLKRIQNTLG
jgi:predicted nucleic acid-binding protein